MPLWPGLWSSTTGRAAGSSRSTAAMSPIGSARTSSKRSRGSDRSPPNFHVPAPDPPDSTDLFEEIDLAVGTWEFSMLSSSALLPTPPDRAVVLRRVTWRLIPFAFICYVVAYVDRVNIGFAARELQRDLHLSATAFGVGAGLFFVGYCVFEIPSNLILDRVGARRWIARIMIVWGLVSMATMFITDLWSFMAARVILGIAEAGFFPGMVLYLTYWIPARERARANALFMMAAPVSVIVGAPAAEALLSMHGAGGLREWQWLFRREGLPAVVLGVLPLGILTHRPGLASGLPPAERDWLASTMREERAQRGETGHASVGRSLRSG